MQMRPCSRAFLIALSGAILLGGGACSRTERLTQRATTPTETLAPAATSPIPAIAPGNLPASPAPQRDDPYKLALEKADSAKNISISAQSQDDWSLVASRWQQAIQLMQSVPVTSPYRALIKAKLPEYQRNLAFAKKQAARADIGDVAFDPGVLPVTPRTYSASDGPRDRVESDASPGTGRVFRARIKRREGGTPVIDVTFNGRRTFEMIVDTGASGTVITEQMAAALGVSVVGKAKVDTASDRGVEVPLAYLNSISVGGAVVKGVVVAIGGSALDTGLLGHDFFGDYDVTVKRDVVEFRQR